MRTFIAVALALASTSASAAPRAKVAVTEIRTVQGVGQGTATILSDIIVSEVSRAGFDVISQSDIVAMVGFERQKKVLGCSEDSSCLAEIGGALGVDYMLAGQVGQIGTRYRISLLLVDSRKAKVLARAARFCGQDEDALARAAEETVRELLAPVRGAPPARASSKETEAPADAKAEVARAEASPAAKDAPAKQVAPRPDLSARPPAASVAAEAGKGSWFRPSRKAAYWTMGAGGAVLIAGAVTGLVAKRRYDRLDARQGEMGYYDAYLAEKSGIRRLAVAADVMMATGIAATGVGGFMWWRSGRRAVAISPAPGPGGAALVAAGTF